MPTFGLRFRTYSMSLGSAHDWFVPDQDMPDAMNSRGTEVFRDIHTTPSGNTYLYDKGKRKRWDMSFQDMTTLGMTNLQHCVSGWLGSRQITQVYYGTSVIGTLESPGSMSSAGQLWGTCWLDMPKIAQEVAFDLWNADITITEFGGDQIFT